MKSAIRKLYDLLSPRERRNGIFLLGISLISALLDTIGVASIMPFMAVITDSTIIENNTILHFFYQKFGFTSHEDFLLLVGTVTLLSLLSSIAFRAFATWAQLYFIYMREYNLSQRLFCSYLSQPYTWFLNRHSAELSKMLLSEVSQVMQGVMTPLIQLFTSTVLAIALIVLMTVADPGLSLSVFGILGTSYFISYHISNRYLARIAEQRFGANKMRFNTVSEAFGGIKDLKASGYEQTFIHQYDKCAKLYANKYVDAQVVAQAPRFFLEALTFGGLILVVLYFLRQSTDLSNILPILGLYVFAGYRLIPALQQIFGSFVNLRFTAPSLDALHAEVMAFKESTQQYDENKVAYPFHRTITLQKITYTYPFAAKATLQDVSLTIKAGTSVALVGATGSGKTTIIDLILGLLRPDQGEVVVDDVSIDEVNLRQWQKAIGYVPQHIFLSDNTVWANIAFGVSPEKVDHRAVEKAARLAMIHDFVSEQLPQGYNTQVGERGVRLSGGQRQRIGIARALYRNPSVLIFDEATSALDNITEKELLTSIDNLRGKVTVIVVAHRMSTVRHCDYIYLIQAGKIIDHGKFDELLAKNEIFQNI